MVNDEFLASAEAIRSAPLRPGASFGMEPPFWSLQPLRRLNAEPLHVAPAFAQEEFGDQDALTETSLVARWFIAENICAKFTACFMMQAGNRVSSMGLRSGITSSNGLGRKILRMVPIDIP